MKRREKGRAGAAGGADVFYFEQGDFEDGHLNLSASF
jgi:hypothetical protein